MSENSAANGTTWTPLEVLEKFFIISNPVPVPSAAPVAGKAMNLRKGRGLNIIEIGKQFFSGVQLTSLVDYFLTLSDEIPLFVSTKHVRTEREGLSFRQFFFKCFLLYCRGCGGGKPTKGKTARDPNKQEKVGKIPASQEELQRLYKLLAEEDFPFRCKIWNLAQSSGILSVYKNNDLMTAITVAIEYGTVSFSALSFALLRYNQCFADMRILSHLLLIGRISGQFIEEFLMNRPESMRQQAREVVLLAESWTRNMDLYSQAVIHYAHRPPNKALPFNYFCSNMTELMVELKHELPRINTISRPWAYTAFTKAAHRRYVTQEWGVEQLNDLILCLLQQRPEMRSFISRELRERYGDAKSSVFWYQAGVDTEEDRIKIQKSSQRIDCAIQRSRQEETSEGPSLVLTIPDDVDVFVVDSDLKISFIVHHLKKISASEHPIVGLDAEWSPYVLTSRASILQIAFYDAVFIIDLDKEYERLDEFIDELFLNTSIVKIGFHFAEDLLQLRRRLPNCNSLYEPNNLICISKLVEQIAFEIRFSSTVTMDMLFHVDVTQKEEEETESETAPESGPTTLDDSFETSLTPGSSKTTDPYLDPDGMLKNVSSGPKYGTMGLSSFCQGILGKTLNKAEQCSVWDRRPLRNGQLKYAALDAYCLIMLYKECAKFAQTAGVDIKALVDKQDPIRIPLPLFFDRTRLKSYIDHQQMIASSPWEDA